VDELMVVASFLANPPAELSVVELRPDGSPLPAARRARRRGQLDDRGGEGGI
jgi:hypothetical protein